MAKTLKDVVSEAFTPKKPVEDVVKDTKEAPPAPPEYDPSLPDNKQRWLR